MKNIFLEIQKNMPFIVYQGEINSYHSEMF